MQLHGLAADDTASGDGSFNWSSLLDSFKSVASAATDVYKVKAQADVQKAQSQAAVQMAQAQAQGFPGYYGGSAFPSFGLPTTGGTLPQYQQTGFSQYVPLLILGAVGIAAFVLLQD